MIDKANPNDVLSLREALNMEIMVNQALIDLLVSKGIMTQNELLTKIEEIRREAEGYFLKETRMPVKETYLRIVEQS